MKKQRFFLLLILLTLLAGCAKTPSEPISEPTPTEEEISPTSTTEPTPTEMPQVYQLPEPPANRTQYKLDLIFNYYSHFGSVTEQITYINKSNQPMSEILLVVPPRNFDGSYEQYSLSNDLMTTYREDGIFTYLTLSRPLEPLETTVIKLSFRIYLPDNPGIFGYTNQQANVSDWYPFIPPYDETHGWLAYPRIVDKDNIIVGESVVNEFSDFEVNL
ncbi:MAG: M1 family metallopeptidase, partial [Chloroflexi bacterium]|nr:M1 family metallopeptidase [Chloroflexota bacterium]